MRGAFGDDEPGGESVTLTPRRPLLATTHIDMLYAAALHGLGIAGLPSFVAEDALLEHALERVLPEWRLFNATIYAAMPTRKHVPARTRAFVDFLVGVFGGEDRDPWLSAAGCETQRAAPGSVERVDAAGAHQRLEQPRQRPQAVVARGHLVRVGEEARQVLAVLRLAVAVLQAAEDAQHLQVALQAHPFELAPELAEVVGHRQRRPGAPAPSSAPPSRSPALRPRR